MSDFIDKLEHMQRTQDSHLQRIGKALTTVGRSVRSGIVVLTLAEALQAKEEQRLDPAARELSSILPTAFEHHDRAIDRLVTIIGVMATRVDMNTLTGVQEAVKAGFELMIMLDDVDVVAGITSCGRGLRAMRVVAQFLCALKGWIIVTERLIERAATASDIASYVGHTSTEMVQKRYVDSARPKPSPRKPRAPRPPANG